MAIIKIVNQEGGSDARYDVSRMTEDERRQFDGEGRPLGANNPDQYVWTPGLPGARGGVDQANMEMGGGGGGGSVIPNSGTYLEEQAMAQQAYDRAIAALTTQRKQRQISSGLGEDWQVDPLLQYGGYQQMLMGQAQELGAADDDAMSRGLQGAGLGRQAEGLARYGHTVQNLGFKNQMASWEQEYQGGRASAEYDKKAAMLRALQNAYASNYGNWGGGGGGSSGASAAGASGYTTGSGYTIPYNMLSRGQVGPAVAGEGRLPLKPVPKRKPTAGGAGGTVFRSM